MVFRVAREASLYSWLLVYLAFGETEVGEHFISTEVPAARRDGGYGRENVGMSNHKSDEKSDLRKPKVSVAMAINHGLGGPKAMAKAEADG